MEENIQVRFIELLLTSAVITLLDVAIMALYIYLAVLFKRVSKVQGNGHFKLLSVGFWFAFMSQIIPSVYYVIAPVALGDDLERLSVYFVEIPYYLFMFCAISKFIRFSKQAQINK